MNEMAAFGRVRGQGFASRMTLTALVVAALAGTVAAAYVASTGQRPAGPPALNEAAPPAGANGGAGAVDGGGNAPVPWFLRGVDKAAGSTTAGEQYAAVYAGRGPVPPGSTSASQQYLDWYTRPSDLAGSTSASEQYRAWYLRDADDR